MLTLEHLVYFLLWFISTRLNLFIYWDSYNWFQILLTIIYYLFVSVFVFLFFGTIKYAIFTKPKEAKKRLLLKLQEDQLFNEAVKCIKEINTFGVEKDLYSWSLELADSLDLYKYGLRKDRPHQVVFFVLYLQTLDLTKYNIIPASKRMYLLVNVKADFYVFEGDVFLYGIVCIYYNKPQKLKNIYAYDWYLKKYNDDRIEIYIGYHSNERLSPGFDLPKRVKNINYNFDRKVDFFEQYVTKKIILIWKKRNGDSPGDGNYYAKLTKKLIITFNSENNGISLKKDKKEKDRNLSKM